ncbi:hypothetical protein FRD01_16075 [Microvenator marinus]|uniref:Uncharacterized protein n=1 Tax=Microvenator marinus TaxID=2600177 RepID=A0A5B8XT53_9DELT|nr:hypothetical protein [Microvenator marinus]QED28725.1 hypothetical protein FRD01_16075 [Microvenator marinus]
MNTRITIGFLLALSLGCGGSAERQIQFPSAQRVQQLAQSAPAPNLEDTKLVLVDEWALIQSPQVAGGVPLRTTNPVESILGGMIRAGDGLEMTEAAACTANEIARYIQENGKPAGAIETFIARRCGLVHPSVQFTYRTSDRRLEPKDIRQIQSDIQADVDSIRALGRPFEVGMALYATDKGSVLSLIYSEKEVEVEPFNMQIQGTQAVIQGTSNMPNVGYMWASVNQGTHGYETCELDARVELPKFRVVCNILVDDPYTSIAIYQKERDRFLGYPAASVIVASGKQPTNVYRTPRIRAELMARADEENPVSEVEVAEANMEAGVKGTEPSAGDSAPVDATAEAATEPKAEMPKRVEVIPQPKIGRSPATYHQDIVTLVNAIRERQKLAPIGLEKAQSDTVAKLAAALLASENPKEQDEISLAIMAGWDVGGRIVNGTMQTSYLPSTDPVAHLDLILDSPQGRAFLLDPQLSTVAIGANLGSTTQLVMAGYHFAPEESIQRRTGQVLRKINAARKGLGLPAAKESKKMRGVAVAISDRLNRGEDMDDTANAMMATMVKKHNRGVRGYWQRVASLDEIQLPRAVLAKKSLTLSVAVGLAQDEGFPWSEYIVVISYLD